MHPLPKPSVDTGMGLERIAAVLQHVHSNYEIDLFVNLLAAAKKRWMPPARRDCDPANQPSLKVIADHIRACSFTVADGVIPGNEGRGYVLRRIARRAIRHGYKLGARARSSTSWCTLPAGRDGRGLPELRREAAHHRGAEAGRRALPDHRHGHGDPEGAWPAAQGAVDGETAFKLHDTFGFPST